MASLRVNFRLPSLLLLVMFSSSSFGQFQVVYPEIFPTNGFNNNSLAASAAKYACVVTASKAGDIQKIRFVLGTVTTGGDVRVSLQDIDPATGHPDGTVDQSATVNILDTDDGANKITGNLSANRTVAAGDVFAVVVDVDTYVAQNMFLRSAIVNYSPLHAYVGQNYCDSYSGGSWTKQTAMGAFGIEYSDGSYDYNPTTFGVVTMTSLSFSSTNVTQDEIALRFTVPVTVKARCGYFVIDGDAAATARLYEGGSVIGTSAVALDSDVRVGVNEYPHLFCTASEMTLTPGNTYRWALEATTTTSIAMRYFDVASATVMNQVAGGTDVYWDARVDAGSWTSTTTRRPIAGMIFYGATAGGGGGSNVGGGFVVVQ